MPFPVTYFPSANKFNSALLRKAKLRVDCGCFANILLDFWRQGIIVSLLTRLQF